MPHFGDISPQKIVKKQEKLAKLKLFGGQNAAKNKFNWVVQISELGYKDGKLNMTWRELNGPN